MLTNSPPGARGAASSCLPPPSPIWICHFIYLTYLFMEWLMRRVRRCGHTGGHPRLAAGTTRMLLRYAQLPALPAGGQGWGHHQGGHCWCPGHRRASQSWQEAAEAPLWWLWQKVRQPWTLVLRLLCWIPGNLVISTMIWRLPEGLSSLHQHQWQQ